MDITLEPILEDYQKLLANHPELRNELYLIMLQREYAALWERHQLCDWVEPPDSGVGDTP